MPALGLRRRRGVGVFAPGEVEGSPAADGVVSVLTDGGADGFGFSRRTVHNGD